MQNAGTEEICSKSEWKKTKLANPVMFLEEISHFFFLFDDPDEDKTGVQVDLQGFTSANEIRNVYDGGGEQNLRWSRER